MVRYCGWYSNVSQGKRKKTRAGASETAGAEIVEAPLPAISQALRHRWGPFIQQVYEAGPCSALPQCGGP